MKDIYIGRYAPTPETRDMKIYRFGDLKHYLWKVREIQFWMPVHTPECKFTCTIRVENRPIKIIYVHIVLLFPYSPPSASNPAGRGIYDGGCGSVFCLNEDLTGRPLPSPACAGDTFPKGKG